MQRFRQGFTALPPAGRYGEAYRKSKQHGLALAEQGGWLMASELLQTGVDFSFAPVLDLDFGVSEVIGDRGFDRDPDNVSALAHAWMQGAHQAGMAVVGKHYPGHGWVRADSHKALPVDTRLLDELLLEDLRPFERMIRSGMEAIMPAHVIYKNIDPQLAGFSSFWLKEVLRNRLGFQGVIFSDDLSMAAAGNAGGYAERATAALHAGCDMVLACNNRPGAAEILDALAAYNDPVAHLRLIRMHGRRTSKETPLREDPRWAAAVHALSAAETPQPLELDME